MNGTIKILEGNSFAGKVLIEESAEVQPSSNKLNPLAKIKLNKSVFCKKNLDYTISLTSNSKFLVFEFFWWILFDILEFIF